MTARFQDKRSGGDEGTSDDEVMWGNGGLSNMQRREASSMTMVVCGEKILTPPWTHQDIKPQIMAVFSTSPAWFCLPNLKTKFDGKLQDVRETPRSKKEKKIEKIFLTMQRPRQA